MEDGRRKETKGGTVIPEVNTEGCYEKRRRTFTEGRFLTQTKETRKVFWENGWGILKCVRIR